MQQSSMGKVSKGAALFIAAASNFLTPFMSTSVNIALPQVGTDFGLDAITLNWIATIYLLAAAMFLVPVGRIADIYGRKKLFIMGMAVYTAAALLITFSSSAAMLIITRFIQGIGAAMMFGTGMAIAISAFPQKERGKAIGIIAACVYIGSSIGPVVGGFLTHYVGWRSVFLVIVPLGIAVLLVAHLKMHGDWKEAKGEKFDYTGSLIYSLTLLSLIYGFSRVPDLASIPFVIAGIIGIVLFIWWEGKSGAPILNLSLFKGNRAFIFSNLAALLNYSATFAVTFLVSLYLQYLRGFSADLAGIILISQPLLQSMISPFAGRLSDRIEPRKVASTGMAITTAGLAMLAFLGKDSSIEYLVICLVTIGIGFSLFTSPNTNAAMSAADKKYYGVASGVISTMRVLGQVLSMGIVMIAFAVFMGRVKISPEFYPQFQVSFNISFIVFAVLCFGGIFASLARGNLRPANNQS